MLEKSEGLCLVAREDARVLILGTLPGRLSLQEQEYYANPSNAFWKIMCDLIGSDHHLSYRDKTIKIMEKGIAIWDVCRAANRTGSLDSAIRNAEPNDFKR